MGLALVGFTPTPALAEDPVIDLELGGEGAVSCNISNIAPGDTGIRTVTLHNDGSASGLVTIWISDIVSSEGANPESEGNTVEPGELIGYLLFNLSCSRLSTNLDLPLTIEDLPHSPSDVNYITITSLNVGETVSLNWEWELPPQAGNDVQGDSLSFTINYMLEQHPFDTSGGGGGWYPDNPETSGLLQLEVDVLGTVSLARISRQGILAETVKAASSDRELTLTIPQGTTVLDELGNPVTLIKVRPVTPPAPTDDSLVAVSAYDSLSSCTFDPPIVLTLRYDPQVLSGGLIEENLVIGYYDRSRLEWKVMPSSVDTEAHTVTTSLTQLSTFGMLAIVQGTEMTPPSPASPTQPPGVSSILPSEVSPAPPPDAAAIPTPKVNAPNSPETVPAVQFNLRDLFMMGVSVFLSFGLITKIIRRRHMQAIALLNPNQ